MVNEILECPIDAFLDHYAPFKPSDNSVTTAFDELHKDSLLKKVGKGVNRSWAFADYAEHVDGTESQVFKSLEKIMLVLQSPTVKDATKRPLPFSYKDCPSSNMASEVNGTNFKVDACITSKPEETLIVLSDVVAIAEFKKSDASDDIEDNRLKLVSAATQIMNDDPRRMWVYGVTIEDTQMAVWYFCRSHSIKSVSFNFTRNVNTFNRVFLSLLYATRQEIGYDPTVHRVRHNNEICYVYEVGTKETPRYYRTIEPIFAARVLCITGRKTRVWKVVEVEGYEKGRFGVEKSSEHVVLKDGWLDGGSRSEKQNLTDVFERLRHIQPSDYEWASGYLRELIAGTLQNDKYKEYFMEIIDSRRLGKTKACHQSAQPNSRILSFAEHKPINPLHLVNGTTQSGDHSGTSSNVPSLTSIKKRKSRQPREYKIKEQHRLIYRHVGCPLTNAKDLSTAFYAIHDTFIALVLLYLARWTHRDISAGNIIIVEKDGSVRGKLSDLEYAREFSDETFSVDPKTGTPYFMPLEIHSSRPLYNPYVPENHLEKNKGKNPNHISQYILPPVEEEEARPMKFRFLHDLESLWWVVVWIVLYRVGGEKAHQLVEDIFTYSDSPSNDRITFFTTQNLLLLHYIHVKLKPLVPTILAMRVVLMNSYLNAEKSENMLDPRTYGDIYDLLWGGIGMLHALVTTNADINGVNFQYPVPRPKPTEENRRAEENERKTKKRLRSQSKPKDDEEHTSSRRASTRAKLTPTGPLVNRPKRATELPRRK